MAAAPGCGLCGQSHPPSSGGGEWHATFAVRWPTERIAIPQKDDTGPKLDPAQPAQPAQPARWMQRAKVADAGAVWDFIQRPDEAATVVAFDLQLTAESIDGLSERHSSTRNPADGGLRVLCWAVEEAPPADIPTPCATGRR